MLLMVLNEFLSWEMALWKLGACPIEIHRIFIGLEGTNKLVHCQKVIERKFGYRHASKNNSGKLVLWNFYIE